MRAEAKPYATLAAYKRAMSQIARQFSLLQSSATHTPAGRRVMRMVARTEAYENLHFLKRKPKTKTRTRTRT